MPLDYLYLQIIYVRCKQIIEFHYITSLNSHTHSKKQLVEYIFDRTLFIAYKRDFGVFDNDNIVPVLKRYKHIFGLAFASILLIITFVPFHNIASSSINTQAPPPSADPDGYPIPTGTLTVIKQVRGGGPLQPQNWQLQVVPAGTNPTASITPSTSFQGSSTGTSVTVGLGGFRVLEVSPFPSGDANYRTSFEGDGCNATMVAGQNLECRVVNTYQPPTPGTGTLTVIKHVIGGNRNASDFTIRIGP